MEVAFTSNEESQKARDEACASGGYCGEAIPVTPPGYENAEEYAQELKKQAADSSDSPKSEDTGTTAQVGQQGDVNGFTIDNSALIIIGMIVLLVVLLLIAILSALNRIAKKVK